MNRREQLEKLLAREPADPFLHYALAQESLKEGELEDALRGFDRVLELDRGYVAAYLHKANALVTSGRPEEARAVLRQGIEAARETGDAHAAAEMQGLLDLLP